MSPLNDQIREYTAQLHKGDIQKAYQGIMSFMSNLRIRLEAAHTDYATSALYFGYMDMTYFAFTPAFLRENELKIALVYLHEDCRFDVWLSAKNRHVQATYHEFFKDIPLEECTLSPLAPGIDAIIESTLVKHPDFDRPEQLIQQIEERTLDFTHRVISLIGVQRM